MRKTFLTAATLIYTAFGSLSAQMSSGLPGPLIQNVFNAPNPFDSRLAGFEGQTRISYVLLEEARVTITLFDLFGHRVQQWSYAASDSGGRAGENQMFWDGTNAAGQKVSKGGYLARIEVVSASGTTATIRKIGVIH